MSEWWLSRGDGKTEGPLSTQALVQGLVSGQIPKRAHVCRVGDQSWVRIAQIDEIWEAANPEQIRTNITEQPWFLNGADSGHHRLPEADGEDERTQILTPLPMVTPGGDKHPLVTPLPRRQVRHEARTPLPLTNATPLPRFGNVGPNSAMPDTAASMRAKVPTLDGISDVPPPRASQSEDAAARGGPSIPAASIGKAGDTRIERPGEPVAAKGAPFLHTAPASPRQVAPSEGQTRDRLSTDLGVPRRGGLQPLAAGGSPGTAPGLPPLGSIQPLSGPMRGTPPNKTANGIGLLQQKPVPPLGNEVPMPRIPAPPGAASATVTGGGTPMPRVLQARPLNFASLPATPGAAAPRLPNAGPPAPPAPSSPTLGAATQRLPGATVSAPTAPLPTNALLARSAKVSETFESAVAAGSSDAQSTSSDEDDELTTIAFRGATTAGSWDSHDDEATIIARKPSLAGPSPTEDTAGRSGQAVQPHPPAPHRAPQTRPRRLDDDLQRDSEAEDEPTALLPPVAAPRESRQAAERVNTASRQTREDAGTATHTGHGRADLKPPKAKDSTPTESLLSDPSELLEECDDESSATKNPPIQILAVRFHPEARQPTPNPASRIAISPPSAPPSARRPRLPSAPSIVLNPEPMVHQEATQPAARALRRSGAIRLGAGTILGGILAILLVALAIAYFLMK